MRFKNYQRLKFLKEILANTTPKLLLQKNTLLKNAESRKKELKEANAQKKTRKTQNAKENKNKTIKVKRNVQKKKKPRKSSSSSASSINKSERSRDEDLIFSFLKNNEDPCTSSTPTGPSVSGSPLPKRSAEEKEPIPSTSGIQNQTKEKEPIPSTSGIQNKTILSQIVMDTCNDSFTESSSDTDEEYKCPVLMKQRKIVTPKFQQMRCSLTHTAKMADLIGTSNMAVAKIVNCILEYFNIVSKEDQSNVIDKSKIRRELSKNRKKLQQQQENKDIRGLYFDGRKDQTICIKNS
ncbi:unnamed protein product [Psylliodes chrysocephalus]|uniref:Uncharacterized protein n=1 Tax=Psylliodes chrysocephalus TaxID=3402493 RepID=A0A9P0D408_9CUCU|nr:unnamed protein product [Psylliodes chrysocephala]